MIGVIMIRRSKHQLRERTRLEVQNEEVEDTTMMRPGRVRRLEWLWAAEDERVRAQMGFRAKRQMAQVLAKAKFEESHGMAAVVEEEIGEPCCLSGVDVCRGASQIYYPQQSLR